MILSFNHPNETTRKSLIEKVLNGTCTAAIRIDKNNAYKSGVTLRIMTKKEQFVIGKVAHVRNLVISKDAKSVSVVLATNILRKISDKEVLKLSKECGFDEVGEFWDSMKDGECKVVYFRI